MKCLYGIKGRWFITGLMLSALALNGCGGSNGSASPAVPPATVDPGAPPVAVGSPGNAGAIVNPEIPVVPVKTGVAKTVITIQGNILGDANAALTGALLPGVTLAAGATPPPRVGPYDYSGFGSAG